MSTKETNRLRRAAPGVLACLLVLAASVPATADDLLPPAWRGQSGTTWAIWEFDTSDPHPAPNAGNNPYGQPAMSVFPGLGQTWMDVWGGHQGVWPLGGTIVVTIPNNPQGNPSKDIQVQLTWARDVPGETPFVWESISGIDATLLSQTVLGPTGQPGPRDTWYQSTYAIHLEPNPEFETIRIQGGILVDELVIDTICVPEPATMSLLAVGAIGALLRRRSAV